MTDKASAAHAIDKTTKPTEERRQTPTKKTGSHREKRSYKRS